MNAPLLRSVSMVGLALLPCLGAASNSDTAAISNAVVDKPAATISSTGIEQNVIASLPKLQGKGANVVADLDLTKAFGTRTRWTFVAAILAGSHFDGADGGPVAGGALGECFVDGLTPHCMYGKPKTASDWFSTPIGLYSAKIVFRGADRTLPLLMVSSGSALGGDGSHAIFTQLFTYDRRLNQFKRVFSRATGSNSNQKTRFLEQGPLRGDVVVDEPTSSAPYGYWMSVYTWNGSDSYSLVLRYRSATHYGDGNRLAVIDSEMPGILRRLGLWKSGDPLPAPSGCTRPALRHGEEWCQ